MGQATPSSSVISSRHVPSRSSSTVCDQLVAAGGLVGAAQPPLAEAGLKFAAEQEGDNPAAEQEQEFESFNRHGRGATIATAAPGSKMFRLMNQTGEVGHNTSVTLATSSEL